MTTTDALALSVDDRRALWALTERHLRSETFAAVLLVRDALRRGATVIDVRTRGDQLVVEDDGRDLDDVLTEIAAVLDAPAVPALHRLELVRGTDLLVAVATASAAEARGRRKALALEAGRTQRHGVVDGGPRNRVTVLRPRRLRQAEREELRAWVHRPLSDVRVDGGRDAVPGADVRIDGKRLGAPPSLPPGVFFARQVRTGSGRGQIGIMLDDTVSRFTVYARGVWVSQEQQRPRDLPLVGLWDSDVVPTEWGPLLASTRSVFARAGEDLVARLALDFDRLGTRWRRRLRRALVRGAALPPAFLNVPLFDSARGPFTIPLSALLERDRVVVGDGIGDVFTDDDGRAFLRRQLGDAMVEALPPPRRRLHLFGA